MSEGRRSYLKKDGQSHLVIERKPGESFSIGEDITVQIDRMNGKNIRISVFAPKTAVITRDDIINTIPLLRR